MYLYPFLVAFSRYGELFAENCNFSYHISLVFYPPPFGVIPIILKLLQFLPSES